MDMSRLDALIAQAEEGLDRATGGGPLCAAAAAGGTAPAAKYYEGRWAALTELRRAGPDTDGATVRNRWVADLRTVTEREASAAWIAYVTGGVDGLADVLDA